MFKRALVTFPVIHPSESVEETRSAVAKEENISKKKSRLGFIFVEMKILLDSEFATETISNKKVWENERLGTDIWWWQATDDWLHLFIYHELARETQIAFI